MTGHRLRGRSAPSPQRPGARQGGTAPGGAPAPRSGAPRRHSPLPQPEPEGAAGRGAPCRPGIPALPSPPCAGPEQAPCPCWRRVCLCPSRAHQRPTPRGLGGSAQPRGGAPRVPCGDSLAACPALLSFSSLQYVLIRCTYVQYDQGSLLSYAAWVRTRRWALRALAEAAHTGGVPRRDHERCP